MGINKAFLIAVKYMIHSKAVLIAENLALRQQLAVLHRTAKRPRLCKQDRIFWGWLSRLWKDWRSVLLIVQPETVVKWHHQGFRLFWRWKSRRKSCRSRIDAHIRTLIRRMSQENATWGVPRIKSELALLGYDIAESTIANYMIRYPRPPSQTWRTFLKNHAKEIAGIDFFTVPAATFRIFYVFIVLRHSDRKLLHLNITYNPTACWTANQIIQAFPFDSAPRFILRDRDGIYGDNFRIRINRMGIEEAVIARRSPWQNPYCERVIGSIRRECLDHFVIFNEQQLLRILSEYADYYNETRPHLSLNRNSPVPREVDPPDNGKIVAYPLLGGLHHRYSRVA